MGKIACILTGVALVVACAPVAFGPAELPEYDALVRAAIPAEEGQPEMLGPGVWIPNKKSFEEMGGERPFYQHGPFYRGAVALTDRSIVFLQWDLRAKRFEARKRIRYAEIRSVALDRSAERRLLSVRKEDLEYDAFFFTRASGIIDPEKVERAVEIVKSRTGR
jgi:hypothetical protein